VTARLLMTVDTVGGVWQYATELAAALAGSGYQVELAVIGPPADAAQRMNAQAVGATLIDTGLALDWLSADEPMVVATATAIARLAQQRGADLVQLNQPAFAVAPFAMPVVAVAHSCVATWWAANSEDPLPADLAWQALLTARGLARADAVVSPSAAFAAATASAHALACDRVTVVHNGRSLRPRHAPPQNFAFTAGRLWDRGKNAATLDRAAARLAVPFKAAGPCTGPHGETVAFEHLVPLGQLGERGIADILSTRPVFASAARYEPFGLAVLEAALAGCALVLSDIPTFRELWDGAAVFVDPDDANGFAEAIGMLAADMPLHLGNGARAKERAAAYGPAAMAAGMIAVYNRLLHRPALPMMPTGQAAA
jgi:glycosyltransferase involved in cell wall biosynthesis